MDIIWILPVGLLILISCLCITAHINNLQQRQQLQVLEPVMFPHPHPRPPLPPSRISSLTNLVELVIETEENKDPV